MTAVYFTHPGDYALAALSARFLIRQGVNVVLAIDKKDPVPEIEGVEIHRTSFNRRGNLNGTECVRGILNVLKRFADEDDYILKVDSDTLVLSLDWLKGRTEPAVGLHHPGLRIFFGACYALRVDRLDEYVQAAWLMPENKWCSEDIEIGKLLPGIHTWVNLAPGCPFAGHSWKSKLTIEEWKERYQVIVFQLMDGKGKRGIRDEMLKFL